MSPRFTSGSFSRLLFPLHCAVCRASGASLCPACADLLRPAPVLPEIVGLDRTVALFSYEGAGRVVVGRLKFDNHRDSLGSLSRSLAIAVDRRVDLVTWVPTSATRRRARGYDQAHLIAKVVGSELTAPVRATLRRSDRRGDQPQTGRTRSERLATRFVPAAGASRMIPGAVVAVVDDVRTTGASLAAAASVLRALGAAEVIGATLAATPVSWAP